MVGGGDRYWLGQGPITEEERGRALRYLRKNGKPTDRRHIRHRVARMRKRRELNRYLKGKEQAATDPSNPWQVIYGTCQVGGTVTCIHVSGPSDQPNLYLHLVITLAAHQITYIRRVYLDGYEVSWNTDLLTRPTGNVQAQGIFADHLKMQINYGTDSQSALSEFVADAPTIWTSNHRQRGHAHVYLRLKASENLFKGGTPDITFLLTGKYDLYNPVTTATEVSSIAPMVLYDYMTNARFGLGLSLSDFNATRLAAATTTASANISLAAGGTEPRYSLDFHFGVDEAPGAIIDDMLASMAGRLVYSEGKYSVYVGEGRTSVMTITEDMILSGLRVMSKVPRADCFNTVRGTFISETQGFEESDFPAITNSAYVTEDSGLEIAEDLTYGMIISPARCQRLAKIELESVRQGIMVEFTATMAAYQVEPGEWVSLTFSEMGWSAKTFEVMRSALQIDDGPDGAPQFTVGLVLRETAAGIYDWNSGDETLVDLNPDTNLPPPYQVADPTDLELASGTEHLYLRSDGTVFTRLYVSWTAASDAFVQNGGHYEIQYNQTFAGIWFDAGTVPGGSTYYYILDVADGVSHDVRIRSVNGIGAKGNWVYANGHVVVGKTEPPSTPPGITATVEGADVRLRWESVPDLDVREYELRIGNQFSGWNDPMPSIARVRSTTHLHRAPPSGGTLRFRVKAIDTSGNYSTGDASVDLVVTPPSAPTNFSASQVDNTVLLRWRPPATSTFPVDHYKLLRQDGAALTDLGRQSGTFATHVELLPGTFTYRVSAVDMAGNEGPAATVSAAVYSPPDFALRASSAPALSGATLSNALYLADTFSIEAAANTEETWEDHFVINGNVTFQDFIDDGYSFYLEPLTGGTGTATFTTTEPSVWLPVDSSQTWAEHFTDIGFTTTQNFIDGGYEYYLQPNGSLEGSVEIVVDLGDVLPQTIVVFDYVSFGSGVQPAPTVSWRADPGDPWVLGQSGSKRATPSNYRYLKLRLEVAPQTPLDWCVVTEVQLEVQVKEVTDTGTSAVAAGDSSGTTITFTKDFLDVSAIVVTSQGTAELKPVVDFTDAPNPTSFKVLLFDAAGARVSGTVRWNARGVQAVL